MKTKIYISMIAAFIISTTLSKTLFLSSTPIINKTFIAKMINLPNDIAQVLKNRFSQQLVNNSSIQKQNISNAEIKKTTSNDIVATKTNTPSLIGNISDTAMTKLSTGVYAKDDRENNVYYLKIGAGAEWDKQTIVVDGKTVIIERPKGTLK